MPPSGSRERPRYGGKFHLLAERPATKRPSSTLTHNDSSRLRTPSAEPEE